MSDHGFENQWMKLYQMYNASQYLKYISDYLDCRAINFRLEDLMTVQSIQYDSVMGSGSTNYDRNLYMLSIFDEMKSHALKAERALKNIPEETRDVFINTVVGFQKRTQLIKLSRNTFIYEDLVAAYISFFVDEFADDYKMLKMNFLNDADSYYSNYDNTKFLVESYPGLFGINKCEGGYQSDPKTYYEYKRLYAYCDAYLNGQLTYDDLKRLIYFCRGSKKVLKRIRKFKKK